MRNTGFSLNLRYYNRYVLRNYKGAVNFLSVNCKGVAFVVLVSKALCHYDKILKADVCFSCVGHNKLTANKGNLAIGACRRIVTAVVIVMAVSILTVAAAISADKKRKKQSNER